MLKWVKSFTFILTSASYGGEISTQYGISTSVLIRFPAAITCFQLYIHKNQIHYVKKVGLSSPVCGPGFFYFALVKWKVIYFPYELPPCVQISHQTPPYVFSGSDMPLLLCRYKDSF